MDNFRVVCSCGVTDELITDKYGLLQTKNKEFAVVVNVHTCQLEIECKSCGNKFAGGG